MRGSLPVFLINRSLNSLEHLRKIFQCSSYLIVALWFRFFLLNFHFLKTLRKHSISPNKAFQRWVCAQVTTYCIACQCLRYLIFNVGDVTSCSTSGAIQIENFISKIAPLESPWNFGVSLLKLFFDRASSTGGLFD